MGRDLCEHREGSRNYVRVGDPIRIKGRPGMRGFATRVLAMRETGSGVEVDVKHPRTGAVRTFPFSLVQRVAVRKAAR